MNRTVDGQLIPWQILESIMYRGKPRTIVAVPVVRRCGHTRDAAINLEDAASRAATRDETMMCADCEGRAILEKRAKARAEGTLRKMCPVT